MTDFAQMRRTMVDCQLRTFDVNDPAVIAAFDDVPRERFFPKGAEARAFLDTAVELGGEPGDRRFAVPPLVLARLIQAAAISDRDRVLDIACGLGAATAILARIAGSVVGVESLQTLSDRARANLASEGFSNVRIACGPLAYAAGETGPFDFILVEGGVETLPSSLTDRLAEGGRLAVVIMDGGVGKATIVTRQGANLIHRVIFEANLPVLSAFRAVAGFVF
jgi:protein-L-isoaspartate(D-aspartate) O-methyltransferase